MKTLLTYVLVASMGLVTTYSFAKAQEERVDYVASLKSLPLENDDFAAANSSTKPAIQTIPKFWFKKKQSLIYHINATEAIDATIGQKSSIKYRASIFWIPSKPDKNKLKGLFSQATNFRNALINVEQIKVRLEGKHEFSPNAKASIKLPLCKQGIGEYHHHQMCGTFAVFR